MSQTTVSRAHSELALLGRSLINKLRWGSIPGMSSYVDHTAILRPTLAIHSMTIGRSKPASKLTEGQDQHATPPNLMICLHITKLTF